MEATAKKQGKKVNTNVTNRSDWQGNNILISDCYFKYLKEKKRIPTYAEIATDTRLSKMTVRRHIEALDFEKLAKTYKPLTESVMIKHFTEILTKGNPQLVKLWYEVIEQVKTKQQIEHSFNSDEARKKIETLFPPMTADNGEQS